MTTHVALHSRPLLGRIPLLLWAALCAGCSSVPDNTHTGPLPSQPASRLAQLNFGNHTGYGLCSEPNCPSVTPKTLATTPTPPLRPEPIPQAIGAFDRSPPRPSSAPLPLVHTVVVYFKSGEANLSTVAKSTLNEALSSESSIQHIAIVGRTDNSGSEALNAHLASARAMRVQGFIRSKLSGSLPVVTRNSQGACCYVASNETAEGRRLNRRVEVQISSEAQKAP